MAILESALTISVLLLVLLCILDLGVATYRYNLLAEAARRLAREAIVHGSKASPQRESWGPGPISGTIDDPLVASEFIRPLFAGFNHSEVILQLTWLDNGNATDQRVKVDLHYAHQPLVPLFGLPVLDLQASSTLRIVH